MRREASVEGSSSDGEKYLSVFLSTLFNSASFVVNSCDMKAVLQMLAGRDDAPNPDMSN